MKFKNWKNRVMEKVVAPMITALVKYTICAPPPWYWSNENEDNL